nr:MAG TPA: hypothetical protein [Caudoviricetes sp.]
MITPSKQPPPLTASSWTSSWTWPAASGKPTT